MKKFRITLGAFIIAVCSFGLIGCNGDDDPDRALCQADCGRDLAACVRSCTGIDQSCVQNCLQNYDICTDDCHDQGGAD